MGAGAKEKKMANAIVAADDNSFGGRVKSLPQRTKSFYNDVRTEMRKVTAPSRKEVQATTTVVLITIFLFALYFFVVDFVIGRGVDYLFHVTSK
jgi:preprotein translocase subunit SecE